MALLTAFRNLGLYFYTVKKKYFVLGQLEQSSQNKNLLYRQDKPNEPTKEGSLSYVLLDSPFTSVTTVGRVIPIALCSKPLKWESFPEERFKI
jgi:hypothetical protein